MKYGIINNDGKVNTGKTIGALVGFTAATVATAYGGYEVGEAINNAINLVDLPARYIVDVATAVGISVPSYTIGILGGIMGGQIVGEISDVVKEKLK